MRRRLAVTGKASNLRNVRITSWPDPVRAVESIATGLQWRQIRPPVCVTGVPGRPDLEACWELGALLAAEIAG